MKKLSVSFHRLSVTFLSLQLSRSTEQLLQQSHNIDIKFNQNTLNLFLFVWGYRQIEEGPSSSKFFHANIFSPYFRPLYIRF